MMADVVEIDMDKFKGDEGLTKTVYEDFSKDGSFNGRITEVSPKVDDTITDKLIKQMEVDLEEASYLVDIKEDIMPEFYDALYYLAKRRGWKGDYSRYIKIKDRFMYFKDKIYTAGANDQILFRIMKSLPSKEVKVLKKGRKRIYEQHKVHNPEEFIDLIIASIESIIEMTNKSNRFIKYCIERIRNRTIDSLIDLKEDIEEKIENEVEIECSEDFKLI